MRRYDMVVAGTGHFEMLGKIEALYNMMLLC